MIQWPPPWLHWQTLGGCSEGGSGLGLGVGMEAGEDGAISDDAGNPSRERRRRELAATNTSSMPRGALAVR